MSRAGRPPEVQQDPDCVDAAIAVLQGEATTYAHAKRLTGNLYRNHSERERVERRIQREKGLLLQRREQEVGHWLTLRHRRLGIRTLRPGVALRPNGLKQLLRRLGRQAGLAKVHAHRFRHTFATWAIEQDARELDVQHLLGHASPDMVRRYASTYNSEQAARRHVAFSPAERLANVSSTAPKP